MTQDDLVLHARDGAVVTLTVNRPKALNALNFDVLHALGRRLDEVAADSEVRAVDSAASIRSPGSCRW